MDATPLPGRPVRGSRTGRPLFALLDLMTRRWAMRIVWELQDGPSTFLDLKRTCDNMSSSTLTLRLRELVEARVVERSADGRYQLTTLGLALPTAFDPLIDWAARWAGTTGGGSSSTSR